MVPLTSDPQPPDREPRGLSRVGKQFLTAQSALTVRDLVELVQAGSSTAELSRIYDWYFERTMSTIKLAFGAAGASFAALIGVLFTPDSQVAAVMLALAVVISAFAGVSQLRLLAQFHREFVVSLRLLRRLDDLAAAEAQT